MPILALILGLLGGAGAMFFLDPQTGRRRRALLRDQAVKVGHQTGDTLEAVSKQAKNRAQGVVAETQKRLAHEPVADETLMQRIRAPLKSWLTRGK